MITHQKSEVDRSLVEDAVRRCLLSAVTNVNLSETSLPFANKSSMPRMSPSFGNVSRFVQFLKLNNNTFTELHSLHQLV